MIHHSILKERLLHEETCVQNYICDYFTDGNISDLEVTELLIDCLEKQPSTVDNLHILSHMSKVPLTEDTLERINSLPLSDPNSRLHIDRIISSADLDLIKKLPHVNPIGKAYKMKLKKRLEFSKLETEKLWDKLWTYSASGAGMNSSKFDYAHGEWMIAEMCHRRDFNYKKFIDKLSVEYPVDYNGWDDTYLCSMAGELVSIDAIDFLIDCIKIDGDFICERACDALAKIGNAKVIDAISKEYFNENFNFRLSVIGVLENIKSDKSEQLMLELISKEKDVTLKTALAYGLCRHFSKDGIPKVLTLLKYGYDKMFASLEEGIYVTHVINDLNHKDLQKWKKSITEDENRIEQAMNQLSNGPFSTKDMHDAFLRLSENMAANKQLNEFYAKPKKKVGRNDPCPCGSGKKYKRCCLSS